MPSDDNVCRICLVGEDGQNGLEFTSIAKYWPVLLGIVEISHDTDLPQKICPNCEFQIEATQLLRRRIQFTEELWAKYKKKATAITQEVYLNCHLCGTTFGYDELKDHIVSHHGWSHLTDCELCKTLFEMKRTQDNHSADVSLEMEHFEADADEEEVEAEEDASSYVDIKNEMHYSAEMEDSNGEECEDDEDEEENEDDADDSQLATDQMPMSFINNKCYCGGKLRGRLRYLLNPCGHTMHRRCWINYEESNELRQTIRCPYCDELVTSAVNLGGKHKVFSSSVKAQVINAARAGLEWRQLVRDLGIPKNTATNWVVKDGSYKRVQPNNTGKKKEVVVEMREPEEPKHSRSGRQLKRRFDSSLS